MAKDVSQGEEVQDVDTVENVVKSSTRWKTESVSQLESEIHSPNLNNLIVSEGTVASYILP